MKFDNGRQFYRVDFDRRVYLEFIDDSYDCCEIKNLSLGGMFITGIFPKKLEEKCQVYLYHDPKSSSPCLNASGIIVRNTEEGIGVKFISMTYKNYMVLLTTLINNAQQPSSNLHEYLDKYPFEIINN